MSKAYYYCKNFTFKEVNHLFAYGTKYPQNLTDTQKIARLYKNCVRKLMAFHVFVPMKTNMDLFFELQEAIRKDFDTIYD